MADQCALRARTLYECQQEIERLRMQEPDYDILYVDALSESDGALAARLFCQFRPPYRCGIQEGNILGNESKYQYRFSIDDDDPARVLSQFIQSHQDKLFEVALSYSGDHDKKRDEELRLVAECSTYDDAAIEVRIAEATERAVKECDANASMNLENSGDAASECSIDQSKPNHSASVCDGTGTVGVTGQAINNPRTNGESEPAVDQLSSRGQQLNQQAHLYLARGWPPVRLVGKAAVEQRWSKATTASPVPKFNDASNIGLLLGEPSGGLVRPDFEWSAPFVAAELFPEACARFGRQSAPGSGLLLISHGAKSKPYSLPESMQDDPRLSSGHKNKLLVCELLSTGKQSMAPPSIHPDTGEEVVWETFPDVLPELAPDELDRRMGLFAFLASVACFWTDDEHGFWYQRGLALAGVLLETFAYIAEEDRIQVVDRLVAATARDGQDTEWNKRRYAGTTLEKMNADVPAMGLPKLAELIAVPPEALSTFRSWLRLGSSANPDLAQMNRDHAAGRVKGKFRIITWVSDARYPRQSVAEFSGHDDFCNGSVNPKIAVPVFDAQGNKTGEKKIGRGAWWLRQDDRAEYDGIDYLPGASTCIERPRPQGGRSLKILNMYSGFSVEPQFEDSEARCKLYLDHLRENICSGNAALKEYVLDWMASGLQHPDDPGRSALSMRGDPGAGKGIFATEYGNLFGRHFLHVTNRDHVTGKFNSHSAETCLIFVDEALYVEIQADARLLKTLVSESTKILERKGIDAIQIKNYARLIFSTNDRHPLQIEHNDRRYCAIYVRTNPLWANEPDRRKAADNRRNYFKPLLEQMRSGGREALLGFLLRRDISRFNPEAIPETTERDVQKLMSAPAGDKVIMEFAQDGHLPGALANRPWIARANGEDCLYPSMKQRGGRHLVYQSDAALSDILKEWQFKRHRLADGAAWAAPPLADLRAAIDAKYPGVVWDTSVTKWEGTGRAAHDVDSAKQADEIPF